MVGFTRARNLERYIDSQGEELPVDLVNYRVGEIYQDYCVLCHNAHDYHLVYKYDQLNESRKVIIGIHLCEKCQEVHKRMQIVYYPHLLELDSSEELTTAKDSRILLYNDKQEFDDTVHNRYVYLDRRKDKFRVIPYRSCYFCQQSIKNNRPITVEVPMSSSSFLDGGRIFCCETDFHDLTNTVNRYPSALCVRCKQTYIITDEEYIARNHVGSSGLHMCPACTYSAVSALPEHHVLSIYENVAMREQSITRLYWITCPDCNEQFILDLSIDHSKLLEWHFDGTRLYCISCANIRQGNIASTATYNLKIHDNCWVRIKKEGEYWDYFIYNIVKQETKILLKGPPKFTKDVTYCMIIACEEAWKLIPINAQKPLWEDLSWE